ncbi:hypothetical protein OROMI_027922 [Orobanche minor]
MSRNQILTVSSSHNFAALTFDTDGVIKVLKAENGRSGIDVVKTWGKPDRSKSIVAASLCDSLLAVARQDGQIELLDSISGEVCSLKLIRMLLVYTTLMKIIPIQLLELLSVASKGHVNLESYKEKKLKHLKEFDVPDIYEMHSTKLHANKQCSLFGGKLANEMTGLYIYDLEAGTSNWNAESHDSGAILTSTFLTRENQDLIVEGTGRHVRVYDTRGSRKPLKEIDLWKSKIFKEGLEVNIQAIVEAADAKSVHIGTGSGYLFSFDWDTRNATFFEGVGTTSHTYLYGEYPQRQIPSSSDIKFLVKHHEHGIIASGGNSWLTIWDVHKHDLVTKNNFHQTINTAIFYQKDDPTVKESLKRPREMGSCESD